MFPSKTQNNSSVKSYFTTLFNWGNSQNKAMTAKWSLLLHFTWDISEWNNYEKYRVVPDSEMQWIMTTGWYILY